MSELDEAMIRYLENRKGLFKKHVKKQETGWAIPPGNHELDSEDETLVTIVKILLEGGGWGNIDTLHNKVRTEQEADMTKEETIETLEELFNLGQAYKFILNGETYYHHTDNFDFLE